MKYTLDDLYIIIVLYNLNYQKSPSLMAVLDRGINIIVCDNSTDDYGNQVLREKNKVIYLDMQGNKGLSQAYNRAVERVPANKLVMLLDDDTVMDEQVVTALVKQANEGDVFVPVVYDDYGILSPSKKGLGGYRRFKSKSEIGGRISGINSGLVINSNVFLNYKYDENLFLDYIDHSFFDRMYQQGKRIVVLESIELHQSFSQKTDSYEAAVRRLRILKKDLRYYYRNSLLVYHWVIFKKRVNLCIIHKTLKFMFL